MSDTGNAVAWAEAMLRYMEVDLKYVNDMLEGRSDSYRLLKQYIHADGHLIWVDLSVSCLRDEDGRLVNDIAMISDITAQVEAGQRSTAIPGEIGDHPDPIGAMQAQLNTLWSSHPHVPDDVRMQMVIAASEVVANIIEHTGSGRPVGIRMGAKLVGDQVHVAFADNGPPADIDLSRVEMPDAMATRGRGLALAQAVLEQLTHRCDTSGNHWTLIGQRFA